MINVNDIRENDKFNILTNGSVAKIMSVHHDEQGELEGFIVEVTPEAGEKFVVLMSKEYYLDKIEGFEKI